MQRGWPHELAPKVYFGQRDLPKPPRFDGTEQPNLAQATLNQGIPYYNKPRQMRVINTMMGTASDKTLVQNWSTYPIYQRPSYYVRTKGLKIKPKEWIHLK